MSWNRDRATRLCSHVMTEEAEEEPTNCVRHQNTQR